MTNPIIADGLVSTRLFEQIVVFERCFICGIPIAMTPFQDRQYNEHGMAIKCVLGHGTVRKESENQRLTRELKVAQELTAQAETAKNNAEAMLAVVQKKHKRLERRIAAGVCPHCQRTFQNVQRHMATKHGEQPEG